MKVVFSSTFKQDLLAEETRYASISSRLGEDFHERVKATIRTVIRWQGGDHVGTHGFPCRKCRPFPHLVYFVIEDNVLHILGLVHERQHPDYVRRRLEDEKS